MSRQPMPPVRFRSDRDLSRAFSIIMRQLQRNMLIAYPTETVYGIGGAVTEQAVAAARALKGRDSDKPFLMLVSESSMLEQAGIELNETAGVLADAFWPGPLTLVVNDARQAFPALHDGVRKSVAVRVTSHPLMQQLISAYGAPITSTSANREGEETGATGIAITASFAESCMDGSLLVLDAGPLQPSPPSTVIDCTSEPPRVLRRGAISPARLRAVLPQIIEPG